MPIHPAGRRYLRAACVLAAVACLLLAVTAAAEARPNESGVFPHEGAPVVVEDVPGAPVVRHVEGTPGPIALMVFGAGLAVAFIVGGYVGARVATRPLSGPAS
jgi:hypothetical protein